MGQPKLGLHYLRYLGTKWLRYSAITIGVTLFYFILPYTGSGPMFKSEVYREVFNCEANWWPNLIGIGNWWGPMGGMVCVFYLTNLLIMYPQTHLDGIILSNSNLRSFLSSTDIDFIQICTVSSDGEQKKLPYL